MAAHAQGQFWRYHDILYTHQSALERADLESYAMMIGLDMVRFRAALDNHTYLAAVDADFFQGQALGVGGTPAFFINGRLVEGALPYESFVNEIEAELHPCP
jgi:protein-disulfide isomerase